MTQDSYETVDMHYLQLDAEGYVTKMCNPITRSWAIAVPRYKESYLGELNRLQYLWNQYCMAAWDLPVRRDPRVVNPQALLAEAYPVDVLDSTLYGLIQEHGYWAVKHALEQKDPNREEGVDTFGPLAPIEPVEAPASERKQEYPQPRPLAYRLGGIHPNE